MSNTSKVGIMAVGNFIPRLRLGRAAISQAHPRFSPPARKGGEGQLLMARRHDYSGRRSRT